MSEFLSSCLVSIEWSYSTGVDCPSGMRLQAAIYEPARLSHVKERNSFLLIDFDIFPSFYGQPNLHRSRLPVVPGVIGDSSDFAWLGFNRL